MKSGATSGPTDEHQRSYIMILVKYIEILDVSYTIDEILGLAKVSRLAETSTGRNRRVSKCRPVLWSSSGRRVPACIQGFLLSSPISIVESDITCLLRPFERFVYDMHSHK